MNCPRCGYNNPHGFAFCGRCGAPLVSETPWALPGPAMREGPEILIGRDGELAELREAVRNLQAGQGGIVSVIGAAGLGKTRLAEELCQWAGHSTGPDTTPPTVLAATCYPPGETPLLRAGASAPGFSVGSQLLLAYLGPGEEPATRLEQTLQAQLPDDTEFVLHYLTNLVSSPAVQPPDAPPATEPGQRHVFTAFSRVLSALSQQVPLVLLVDDMHWIDESSAALLEHVWPLARQQPILFLLLYEPEENRRCWDLRRQAANLYAESYREVFLYPLPDTEAEQFLDLLLGGTYLPPSTRRAVLQTAGGNPLFIGEVLQWGRQRGPGAWWEDTLPASLPDVLAARIELLRPESRRVLQLAAVIGSVFPRYILAHALTLDGQGEGALQHLQQLQALGMVRPRLASDTRHAYAFTHSVVRQATYESLSESERDHLHFLVAQAIEHEAGGGLVEHYASLAHHYIRTSRVDQAVRYVRLAGDQALWRYADDEAVAYYQAGLRLATTVPSLQTERQSLLRRIATVHARRGQWLDSVRVHEHVLATQADDPVGQAETYQAIARAHRGLGDREAEGYYVQKALSVLPANESKSLRATLWLSQSSIAWVRGEQEAALAAAQQALDLAQQDDDSSLVVVAWNQIGAAHLLAGNDGQALDTFLGALDMCGSANVGHEARLRTYVNAGEAQAQIAGEVAAAQGLFEQALALARRIGHDTWAIWAHLNLAELAFARGEWVHAEEQLRQGEDLSAGRNLAALIFHSILLRGRLLLARGQSQSAYEQFRRAAELAETMGDVVQGLIPARLGQALALWALGRLEPAALLLEQALHLSQQEGTPSNVATARFHLVRCLLVQGNTAAARQVYIDVTPMLRSLQRPRVQAQDLWLRGLLAAAEGQPQAAERDLRASQRAWQRRGYRHEEGQVLLDLARFYLAQGREREAIQSRDEAIALFQLLGAAGDLAQAEALETAE